LSDENGEVRELTAEDLKRFRSVQETDPAMLKAVAASRTALKAKTSAPDQAPQPRPALPDRALAVVPVTEHDRVPFARKYEALFWLNYGYSLSEGEIDGLLGVDENRKAAGYSRFVKANGQEARQ
jgi:hypothetical protein